MRTLCEILDHNSACVDGRDIARLCAFMTVQEMEARGFEPKDPGAHEPIPFTEEAVMKMLESDLAFAFEKALNKRGLSAGLMFEVILMWNWVLDNELQDWEDYAMYGLPLFKATALRYGFDNPIGDDAGNETKYEEN